MRILTLVVALAAAVVAYWSCSGDGNGGGGGDGGSGAAAGNGGTGGDEGWMPLGGPVTNSRPIHLSLAHDGERPVVAWVDHEGVNADRFEVHAKRWNGSSWVQLGGTLTAEPTSIPGTAEVVVDPRGQPVVVFNDGGLVYVRRWNEVDEMWGEATDPPANGIVPWLVLDGDEPLVSMLDITDADKLFVRRWDDGWTNLGDALNAAEGEGYYGVAESRIALDPGGRPVVAFTQHEGTPQAFRVYVKRYETTAWEQVGPSGFPGGMSWQASVESLAIAGASQDDHEIFVAWADTFGSPRNAYVMRWATDDDAWRQVGPALAPVEDGAFYPSMVASTAGAPMVAFVTSDGCLPLVVVKRWDGSDWEQIGDPLNNTDCSCTGEPPPKCEAANLVSMALDGRGNPVVAWISRHGSVPNSGSIYVKTIRLPEN